jgi:hypothetical protein
MLGFGYGGAESYAALSSYRGNLVFFIEEGAHPGGLVGVRATAASGRDMPVPQLWVWSWPSLGAGDVGGLTSFHATLPLWVVFSVFAVPSVWLWYRDVRHVPGRCRHCGYDISGLSSGLCPECGPPQARGKAESRASST